MVGWADRCGRGIAGCSRRERAGVVRAGRDVLLWSGPPIYTLATAADELGLSADDVARAPALFGLAVTSCYGPGPRSTPWRPRLTNWGCQPTSTTGRPGTAASTSLAETRSPVVTAEPPLDRGHQRANVVHHRQARHRRQHILGRDPLARRHRRTAPRPRSPIVPDHPSVTPSRDTSAPRVVVRLCGLTPARRSAESGRDSAGSSQRDTQSGHISATSCRPAVRANTGPKIRIASVFDDGGSPFGRA